MAKVSLAAGDVTSPAASLSIGGITTFSTVDWPGKLAAVCFVTGCPWRCSYCQNRLLWDARPSVPYANLVALMESRRGLLDGVVFSGGEPLGQPGLPAAVHEMREMGFDVGLHTGGAVPARLEEVLPDLSWVGFDVKAPWDVYESITKVRGSGDRARESLALVLGAGVDMEARTTWHPGLLTPDDIAAIARELSRCGVRHWAVQAYRSEGTDGSLPDLRVYPSDVPDEAKSAVPEFEFRLA